MSFVGAAAKVTPIGGQTLEIEHEQDDGMQKVELDTPGIITCDLGLNLPRYPNLRDMMMVTTPSKPLA